MIDIMGCDIHSTVQVRRDEKWTVITDRLFPSHWDERESHTAEPFAWRWYGMFGFLADVRNYSEVPPISKSRGFPEDMKGVARCEERYGEHSFSWLSLPELLAFDYYQTFEDRRGYTTGEKIVTYREFLGPDFFRDLEIMRKLDPDPANVRIVFGFDS